MFCPSAGNDLSKCAYFNTCMPKSKMTCTLMICTSKSVNIVKYVFSNSFVSETSFRRTHGTTPIALVRTGGDCLN